MALCLPRVQPLLPQVQLTSYHSLVILDTYTIHPNPYYPNSINAKNSLKQQGNIFLHALQTKAPHPKPTYLHSRTSSSSKAKSPYPAQAYYNIYRFITVLLFIYYNVCNKSTGILLVFQPTPSHGSPHIQTNSLSTAKSRATSRTALEAAAH